MRVAMADIEQGALDDAVKLVGGDVIGIPTDVSKAASVDALGDSVIDAFGAVHVVCNNAGVGGGGLTQDLSAMDWEWVLGVNLFGVIHGMRVFLPMLLAQGEGHVVNTASMAGLVTAPMMGPYNASKFAVVAISETLHKELAMQGSEVGVSVLCPGWVNTNISESDRNRPVEMAGEGGELGGHGPFGDIVRQLVASGMDPSEVAGLVLDAIETKRFYILTHPDMKDAVSQRVDDILEGRNPAMPTLAQSLPAPPTP
jgi:NAD(P)-dependent dehydrogenase (short-subunit alcohol dehydrogenase family)